MNIATSIFSELRTTENIVDFPLRMGRIKIKEGRKEMRKEGRSGGGRKGGRREATGIAFNNPDATLTSGLGELHFILFMSDVQ